MALALENSGRSRNRQTTDGASLGWLTCTNHNTTQQGKQALHTRLMEVSLANSAPKTANHDIADGADLVHERQWKRPGGV